MDIVIHCQWADDWYEKYGVDERQRLFNRQDMYALKKYGVISASYLTRRQLRNWWNKKRQKSRRPR